MFVIMGHYFAVRRAPAVEHGPPPLYLPRGSIRFLLLLGFAVLAGALIQQHRMLVHSEQGVGLSHAGVTLILVAGFMLGVLMNRFAHGPPSRRVEDIRAYISLGAGVLLLLLVAGIALLLRGLIQRVAGIVLHAFEDVDGGASLTLCIERLNLSARIMCPGVQILKLLLDHGIAS